MAICKKKIKNGLRDNEELQLQETVAMKQRKSRHPGFFCRAFQR